MPRAPPPLTAVDETVLNQAIRIRLKKPKYRCFFGKTDVQTATKAIAFIMVLLCLLNVDNFSFSTKNSPSILPLMVYSQILANFKHYGTAPILPALILQGVAFVCLAFAILLLGSAVIFDWPKNWKGAPDPDVILELEAKLLLFVGLFLFHLWTFPVLRRCRELHKELDDLRKRKKLA